MREGCEAIALDMQVPSVMEQQGSAVKICGLTRSQDVIAARDLGVWALGFVFAPSPRRLEPRVARRLVETAGLGHERGLGHSQKQPLTVGVFTEAGVDEIVSIVEEVGLDAVQLHGFAGPDAGEVAAALGGGGRTVSIIQALPVDVDERDSGRLRDTIARVREQADMLLLDTRVSKSVDGVVGSEGRFGGSGAAFHWGLAREVTEAIGCTRLLVAGGIDPDNVTDALSESGAWGVDVSSGVESSPGVKDGRLMRRLVDRVKEGTAK